MNPGSFVVVRDYSHTDRQHLLKVESVPFKDMDQATSWKEWLEGQYPKYRYNIIHVMSVAE